MSRPWMPLYVADYLADTSHLSNAEHGAYLLLIMHYWQKGPVPDDDTRLKIITKSSTYFWKKTRPVLEKFFTISEGFWYHKRLASEIERAAEISAVRADAGSKGGRAKVKANGKQLPPQPPSQPHPQDVYKTSEGLLLKSATIEQAKEIASGYDVYNIENVWREFSARNGGVQDPDKAFLGFVRSYVKRNPLPYSAKPLS